MLISRFTKFLCLIFASSNNLKNNNTMKNLNLSQRIALTVILAAFLTAVILAKLNLFGFSAAQFTV